MYLAHELSCKKIKNMEIELFILNFRLTINKIWERQFLGLENFFTRIGIFWTILRSIWRKWAPFECAKKWVSCRMCFMVLQKKMTIFQEMVCSYLDMDWRRWLKSSGYKHIWRKKHSIRFCIIKMNAISSLTDIRGTWKLSAKVSTKRQAK